MIKKMVLAVYVRDEKEKQKAMNAVTSLSGIDYLAIDMKANKMTVIGSVDPVDVVCKLRKKWNAKILTVGPAKELEKKANDEDDKDGERRKPLYRSEGHPYFPQYNPYYTEEKPNSFSQYNPYYTEEKPNSFSQYNPYYNEEKPISSWFG